MKTFFDLKNVSHRYREVYDRLRDEKLGSIFGVVEPLKVVLSAGIDGQVLYLTSDFLTANKCYELFHDILGDEVCLIKPCGDNFIFSRAKSNETLIENSIALAKIVSQKIKVVVASIEAAMNYFASPEVLKKNIIKINTKSVIEPSALAKKLVEAGYKREELVGEAGQFSLRGDVLDVFPIGCALPVRIDFFDRDIENISELDPESMKKGKNLQEIELYPCKNAFFDESEAKNLLKTLEKCKNHVYENQTTRDEYIKTTDILESRIENGTTIYGLDYILPLLNNKASIFDYGNFTCVIDESKMVFDVLKSHDEELKKRLKELKKAGTLLTDNNFIEKDEIIKKISSQRSLVFQKLTTSNRFFEPKFVIELKSGPMSRYIHSTKDLVETLKTNDFKGYRNIIFARSHEDAKRLQSRFDDEGLNYKICKPRALSISDDCILESTFSSGFILPEEKIAIFGTYDILPREAKTNKLRVARQNVFSVPKVGDYVVHNFHGIGICEGVQKLSGNFGTKDYVVVRYRDDDRLYVPIDQMDMLDRYSGAEAPKRLSKIGGVEFGKVKEKVKASVKKLAFDLLQLYAAREARKGYVYAPDNELQIEFENSFPYTETEEQLISTSEIKQDMESGKVMERLLCGDVGFGKTEVALRAAFKAIINGKQVAFMAPTTILSEQHYNTAKNRMEQFGVQLAVLNRFKTAKETRQILEGLENGKIDMVCGTHRILSKDVKFKDLGLIILDEEQKFGVEDKEKIKLDYPNVDVLTLSATPIPRTLHMSLSGIRDVSIISTPPSERLPIATYVTEFTEELVRDAVIKELGRNGQVFILYNRVEKIHAFADYIHRIVPEARILVGHGQMEGKELEDVIYKFYHNEADVLICTTIIENGIDIENANTLIVCDSDKFGLAQLYQLRGRVGRGSRMAYAYLTYDGKKVLTEEAYKRLDAISEFTEFGSGFKLAMRDLEIRGSGNVLGAEQHGHLEKVGYELYSKLLSDAVKELKGGKVEEDNDVLVKVALDAYIPDSYMTKSEDRMVAYKTIASIKSKEDRDRVAENFESVFGKLPEATNNLLDIALVKACAKKIGAKEIDSSITNLEIIFADKDNIIGNAKIGDLLYKFRMICTLDFSGQPKICFKRSPTAKENFDKLKEFLLEA